MIVKKLENDKELNEMLEIIHKNHEKCYRAYRKQEIKSKKQGLLVFGIGFACFILSVIYLCYTVLGFIL